MITIVSPTKHGLEINSNMVALCAKRSYHPSGFVAKRFPERAVLHILALATCAPDADIQAALREDSIEGAHQPAAALVERCELRPVPPVTSTEINQHDWFKIYQEPA